MCRDDAFLKKPIAQNNSIDFFINCLKLLRIDEYSSGHFFSEYLKISLDLYARKLQAPEEGIFERTPERVQAVNQEVLWSSDLLMPSCHLAHRWIWI